MNTFGLTDYLMLHWHQRAHDLAATKEPAPQVVTVARNDLAMVLIWSEMRVESWTEDARQAWRRLAATIPYEDGALVDEPIEWSDTDEDTDQ